MMAQHPSVKALPFSITERLNFLTPRMFPPCFSLASSRASKMGLAELEPEAMMQKRLYGSLCLTLTPCLTKTHSSVARKNRWALIENPWHPSTPFTFVLRRYLGNVLPTSRCNRSVSAAAIRDMGHSSRTESKCLQAMVLASLRFACHAGGSLTLRVVEIEEYLIFLW